MSRLAMQSGLEGRCSDGSALLEATVAVLGGTDGALGRGARQAGTSNVGGAPVWEWDERC